MSHDLLTFTVMPYTLSREDMGKINDLINEEVKLSIVDSNPSDNRRKELERRDRLEEKRKIVEKDVEDEDEDDDENKTLGLFDKLTLTFKLIELLGQITNNYYGSLDGERKADILVELYSLGFRGLRVLIEDFEKYLEALWSEIDELVERKGAFTKVDQERIANKLIYGFMEIIAFIFVKRISDSITSRNLFPTTKRVLERKITPAAELVNIAVRLNFPDELSANKNKIIQLDNDFTRNYLTKTLLRYLVIEHLYRFEVKYSDKQSICDKLGISITKQKQLMLSNKKE